MRRSKTRSRFINKKFAALFFILATLTLFLWRLLTFLPVQTNGYMRVEGTLLEKPKVFRQWQYFAIDTYRVKATSEVALKYGDEVQIEGEIVDGRFTNPKIKVVGFSKWRRALFAIRQNLQEKIFTYFSEPQASLLAGVVLGIKEDLPADFRESLRQTGTIHVVVVSGYNISVVAGILLGLSRFIKRQLAIWLALIAITFYTLLVGADPPAVRAAIMGAVAFTAIFLGRQRVSLYALLLAAFLMLSLNPLAVADIGFQLSFLATAGIILFQERIFGFFAFLPKPFSEDIAITLAAQSLVVPVLFYHFGSVSAMSPVANAAVLWTIPLVTIGGFIFLATALVVPLAATVISWLLWALLSSFVFIIEAFGRIPFTYLEFSPNQWGPLFVYYALLIGIIIYLKYGRLARAKQTKN